MGKINRVLFIGSKQMGLRVLQEMYSLAPETIIGILTIDDSSDTRSTFIGFQQFAQQTGLILYVAANRRQSEEIVADLRPDLCFVVGWYWLIDSATLAAVPSGFVGIHNSLLPKYRGGSPLIWAMIKGDNEVGFSMFSFSPGMDDGPIWAQGRVPVNEQDYVSDVLEKLEAKTIQVLQTIYPRILSGEAKPTAQDHGMATYCAQRYPEDGCINWSESARNVFNFVRAQSEPYPGSFTYYDGQRLKIWKAHLFEREYCGMPGQVSRITDDGVYVICGDHRAIILEDIEFADGKRGKPNDLIVSIRKRMSNCFDKNAWGEGKS